MPTLHVVAPFHTVPQELSTCAYTAKTLRLPAMMRSCGYHVTEYANGGSESEASEHVAILPESARQAHFAQGLPFVGSPGHMIYDSILTQELRKRIEPEDFVLHMFGASHAHLVQDFPAAIHVEPGVGYMDKPFGAFRIYESEAWRHYHWGMCDVSGLQLPEFVEKDDRSLSWVVPLSLNPEDWPVGKGEGDEKGPYAVFMGRLIPGKGLHAVAEIIKGTTARIKIAGSGDLSTWLPQFNAEQRSRIELLGPVLGKDRASLLGAASCVLMPTQHVEPFGASGVEGMMTGTPLIANSWGAFTETVIHDETGFLCETIDDWCFYVSACMDGDMVDRKKIAEISRDRFSSVICANEYARIFERLEDLRRRS